VQSQIESTLKEASKYADKDNSTKKEFVLRLKDKVLKLFELENRPIIELASYIWNKLKDVRFSIYESQFYSYFTDDEKGNYSGKFTIEDFIETEIPGVLRGVDSGLLKINGVTYTPLIAEEKESTKTAKTEEGIIYKKDRYTDCFNRIIKTCNELNSACNSILTKYTLGIYHKDKDGKKIIELTPEKVQTFVQNELKPIEETMKKYIKYYSIISNSKDVLDARNKWGNYEKIIAKFLMDSGETIAHISKLMDYSSKFGSIGIQNNPELQKKVEQLGQCPSCHVDIYFEINESLKEQEKQAQFEI